jgi:hypothetical protein
MAILSSEGVLLYTGTLHTSEKTPPLPISSFKSAARLSPEFSSSILDAQSSLPVQMSTCSAYAGMVPLSGFESSISRPSGIEGVGAHWQVGDGHEGIVGNAGLWRLMVEESSRIDERESRHVDRATGRRNMEEEDEMDAAL